MKWLYNLLGVLIGIELGLAIAVSASVHVWQDNTFLTELIIYVAFPVGFVLGIVFGLKAADCVWRRVMDDLFNTPRKIKGLYLLSLAVAVVSVNVICARVYNQVFDGPADSELTANFEQNRVTLDRIVMMIQADKGVRRSHDGSWDQLKGAEIGNKPKPRPQYLPLLPVAGVERGVKLTPDKRGIKLCYWGTGDSIADTAAKGYLYAETPPAPLFSTLDGEAICVGYRHITGNWYLFYDYFVD